MKTPKEFLETALGGNINIPTLKLKFWEEIMLDYAKYYSQNSSQLEPLVSLQKAEIEQQENFMKTLKDIYKAGDMVEMQTLIEIYFENIDSCLINKYNYESDVSLLSA